MRKADRDENSTTAMQKLTNEVRLLFHQFVETGEILHSEEDITMGMRAVLEFILLNGASSVPAIARSRRVTRQHIQVLVNGLLEHEAVELVDNPAHKRSPLVSMTTRGKKTIERMRRREQRYFDNIDVGIGSAELLRAAKTVRTVRDALGTRD